MNQPDYYQVLGVSRSASQDEIKKAYRKLAVKYHPDRNQGDKKAEDRFKEISEAYAVLSDTDNRRKYDHFGHNGFRERHSEEDIFRNFDVGDIFRDFGFGNDDTFSRAFRNKGRHSGFRRYNKQDTEENYDRFFSNFGRETPPPRRRGNDIAYDLHISLKDAVFGAERLVAFNTAEGVTKINVKIPPGIDTGKKLRLTGKGQQSPDKSGRPGDLLVNLILERHPAIRRDGDSLIMDQEIKLSQAVLGTTIQVETLDEKVLNLKVPPGTPSQTKLRLKGHGIPNAKDGTRGDLFVRLLVAFPENLTPKQKEIFQALADEGL